MDSDRPAIRPAVVTIDDDLEVLKAIERDLRHRYAKSYRILSANSGQAALNLLQSAVERNYCAYSNIVSDPLLAKLRADPGIDKVLTSGRECQEAVRSPSNALSQ